MPITGQNRMKKKYLYWFLALSVAVALDSCKKQTDTFATAPVVDYMPMQAGKYIHYRLDSTRYVNFGQSDTVISYDAKDLVDAEITDNEGRPSFRVIRYLRDPASTDSTDYTPNMTYMVTPTRNVVELTEENLRYQKLKLPVTDGLTWKGNSYLPTTPFYAVYQFSNDEDMDLWDYTYQDANQSVELNGNVYDSTVTVVQVADSSNVPIDFPEGLAYKNYWVEQYAKNIGLIYKEVAMWEYQPANAGNPSYFSGFGIKMTIIDHN
jgi:hypothetical protein